MDGSSSVSGTRAAERSEGRKGTTNEDVHLVEKTVIDDEVVRHAHAMRLRGGMVEIRLSKERRGAQGRCVAETHLHWVTEAIARGENER